MQRLAFLYMRNNPGAEINIIQRGSPSRNAWQLRDEVDMIREQLGIQMMAGLAPDVMEAFLINTRNRDFFADWMPLINAHPRFNNDEWFMEAFHAAVDGGELLVFPEKIHFSYISGNTSIPGLTDELALRETISIKDMILLYNMFGGLDSGLHMHNSNSIIAHTLWFSQNFLDWDSSFVNFANPEFISLIENTSQIMMPMPATVTAIFGSQATNVPITTLMSIYFMFYSSLPYDITTFGLFTYETGFDNALLFVNEYGKMYISLTGGFVMSSQTTSIQQALALDFLRFTQDHTVDEVREINESAQFFTVGPVPINRSKFESHSRFVLSHTVENAARDGRLRKTQAETIRFHMDRLTYAMTRPMVRVPIAPMSIAAFFDDLRHSLNLGLISPHEAATRMQNRVMLEILEGN